MQTARTTLARLGALVLCLAFAAPPAAADDTNAALRYWQVWAGMSQESQLGWACGPSGCVRVDADGVVSDEALREALVAEHDNILALRGASMLEPCDFGLDRARGADMKTPHLMRMRSCVNMLIAHARLACDDGDAWECAQSYAGAVRMAEHLSHDAHMTSSLTSLMHVAQIKLYLVDRGEADALDDPARAVLVAALDRFPRDDPFRTREAIESELRHVAPWLRDALRGDGRNEVMEWLRDPNVNEGAEESAARAADAIERGEGVDALVNGVERYLARILDVWSVPDADAAVARLAEELARGDYGDLAAVWCVGYEGVLEQRRNVETALNELRAAMAPRG